MPVKETEALVRICKWDDEQLHIGLEIISKFESFKTKDTDEMNISRRASSMKEGKKFSMTQDLFAKFSKVSKELMVQNSEDILKGRFIDDSGSFVLHSFLYSLRFVQCEISCWLQRREYSKKKEI